MNAIPRLTIAQALTAFADERAAIDATAATIRATTDRLVAREIANAERIERAYSVVRDDRQSGWYDPGVGVMCNQTGVLMNEEPFSTHQKAEEFLAELEAEGK